ncbi:hypothetical protein [Streptomyces sp. BRA346]|uniref:hypothetical protein n=1 Tax=Streptomyces sp. BRA346 TaxID=2878199 RepID=UPI004063FFB4
MTSFLRWAGAAVLVLANVLNVYFAFWALVTEPGGSWDENTLTGIETASFVVVVVGVVTLLLAALPVRKGALSRWWLAPPAVFIVLGAARWTYVAQYYPQAANGP